MKRAILLIVGLVILSAAALVAGVKPAPDPKHTPLPAAQAQPAAQHLAAQAPAEQPANAHAAAPAEGKTEPQAGHQGAAAEHGTAVEHHAGEAESGDSVWKTIARLFNFALLAGSLIYLLRSPFAAFIEGRQVQVKKSLADAANTREGATRQLTLIDEKLQALPGELDALTRRGAADIAAEEVRIRELAEVERQRMVQNAKRDIERRTQLAERQLVQRAGELAVAVATERVKRTITDTDQARLVDRYLDEVRPEATGS